MNGHKVEEILSKIREYESKMAHVELHDVREAFIDIVVKRVRESVSFSDLVERQLSLYCKPPDPRTFYEVCNQPGHLVRERLITWGIDHPSPEKRG